MFVKSTPIDLLTYGVVLTTYPLEETSVGRLNDNLTKRSCNEEL